MNVCVRNIGWWIDYFVVLECLKDKLVDVKIYVDVFGLDYCFVELEFNL